MENETKREKRVVASTTTRFDYLQLTL